MVRNGSHQQSVQEQVVSLIFFEFLESSKSFLAYSWCFRVLSDVDVSDSAVLPRFSELGDG